MKPEEQQIAIGKACGWKQGEERVYSFLGDDYMRDVWISPYGSLHDNLPNYLNSLSVIHEEVIQLGDSTW